jgi:hypothetical protein
VLAEPALELRNQRADPVVIDFERANADPLRLSAAQFSLCPGTQSMLAQALPAADSAIHWRDAHFAAVQVVAAANESPAQRLLVVQSARQAVEAALPPRGSALIHWHDLAGSLLFDSAAQRARWHADLQGESNLRFGFASGSALVYAREQRVEFFSSALSEAIRAAAAGSCNH